MIRAAVCACSAAALIGIVGLGAGQASAGKKDLPYAVKSCTKPRVEPTRIVFTCADAGLQYVAKHWNHWNGKSAGGRGKILANDCDPFCAGGAFHSYKAHIKLYKVRMRTCNGRRLPMYQKARVDVRGHIDGLGSSFKMSLYCI